MSLFGTCDCAEKIQGLEGQVEDLRKALADLTEHVAKVESVTTKTVIAHFENERRKALLRKQEERKERAERYVLPSL
jgi:microcompartment protein CcmL/EutN